jgi:O-antigen/teichoic acid export membrane protein
MTISTVVVDMRRQFERGRMGYAAGVLVSGTFIAQAMVVLASPLLARLYSVEDFGGVGVFSAILGIAVSVASLGYEKSVLVGRDEEEAANALVVAIAAALVVGCVVAIALGVSGRQLVIALNVPELAPYRLLLAVSLTGVGVYQALNSWAIRTAAYREIARTKVAQGIGQVTVQLAVGAMVNGPLGLLLGDVASRVSGVTGLLRIGRSAIRRASLGGMKRAAVRYRDFVVFGAPAALLLTASAQVPTLLISALFGPTVAGAYAFGFLAISAPLMVIGAALHQPLLGRAALLAREDPRALKRLLYSATLKLLVVFGIPVGILIMAGGPLFAVVFGAKWYDAGLYVQIYGIGILIKFVAGAIFPVLGLLGRQRWLLVGTGAGFALIVGGLVAVRTFEFGGFAAMISLGLSWSVLYIVLYALALRAVELHVNAVAGQLYTRIPRAHQPGISSGGTDSQLR